MNRLFFIIITSFLVLSSCCGPKQVQTALVQKDTVTTVVTPVSTDPAAKEDSAGFIRETYSRLMANKVSCTTFSAKIDMDLTDSDGKDLNANAHIRMYTDSLIWVSVTGPLGIEGLRAIITRDSVKWMDKQKKTYTARSISYLQEVTALPLDLSSLQDLLLGNPVFIDPNISTYTKTPVSISFESAGEFFKNIFTIGAADKLLQSSQLSDPANNRSSELTYDDYESKKGMNFSTKRTISVTDKKKLFFKLNYKQYDFNETLSFPFSVPKNYDRE